MVNSSGLWAKIALINLCIVAALGCLMRYKIGFEFPFLDQKYLLEAHSHFAFAGWITHSLYFLIVIFLRSNLDTLNEKIYGRLILINLICAYGMLFSFTIQGYGPVSIALSTLSILIGYVFAYFALKDISRLPAEHPAKNWIKAAIWFSIFSTIGTIVLSYMMATVHFDQTTYLGSIYFFLHFQYNGWFLFACMGLFMDRIKLVITHLRKARISFWLFFLAGVPAYFLSTLWAHLPVWLYAIVVLAAILQCIGWWIFIRSFWPAMEKIKLLFPKPVTMLLWMVSMAFTFKLVLQLGSTIPEVSHLAFGFRPIVIAYLHLVLLLIVSMFLLIFMYSSGLLHPSKKTKTMLFIFTSGVILNEIVLAAQGIGAFSYTVIPFANEILFAIALLLLSSAILLTASQYRTDQR